MPGFKSFDAVLLRADFGEDRGDDDEEVKESLSFEVVLVAFIIANGEGFGDDDLDEDNLSGEEFRERSDISGGLLADNIFRDKFPSLPY